MFCIPYFIIFGNNSNTCWPTYLSRHGQSELLLEDLLYSYHFSNSHPTDDDYWYSPIYKANKKKKKNYYLYKLKNKDKTKKTPYKILFFFIFSDFKTQKKKKKKSIICLT